MLLFIFTIFLLSMNTSSGAPTAQANNTAELSLSALANSCESPILSAQISGKAKDCALSVPPNSEKQFQCMLFYDINRQLCSAIASSKIVLTEDFSSKIDAPQDIGQLCKAAKEWTFTDLSDVYKKYVKLVFSDVVRCLKVCSADNTDILNLDSNYYCKYFKWGSEVLKAQVSVAPAQPEPGVAAVPNPEPAVVNSAENNAKNIHAVPGVPVPVETISDNTKGVLNSNNSTTVSKVQTAPDSLTPDVSIPQTQTGPLGVSTLEKVSSTNKANVAQVDPIPEKHLNSENAPAVIAIEKGPDSDTAKENELSIEQHPELQQPVGAVPDLAEKDEKTALDLNVKTDDKKPKVPVEAPKPPVDTKLGQNEMDGDDYGNDMDSEDSRGPDTQGIDDDTDPGLESDLKQDLDQTKISNRIELQSANDNSQKEFYRGEDFPEEDDHFFSFFLTAIIMVVLLYVLYHNKSKVSKVIMGLIVEGRQPGRRRNSRGHAYKRLDTLEQAMSTNTAAPPSKIIY